LITIGSRGRGESARISLILDCEVKEMRIKEHPILGSLKKQATMEIEVDGKRSKLFRGDDLFSLAAAGLKSFEEHSKTMNRDGTIVESASVRIA
jgi:hypothetical protein